MSKISHAAVVLSGCGVFDGSEINEAVLTLLSLGQAGVSWRCLAPDRPSHDCVNHLDGVAAAGLPEAARRNVLTESARIARGEIDDLAQADAGAFDLLILPGGYGAAKNLCDYAVKGADMSPLPELLKFARAIHEAGKPIGLMCIAPVLAPAIFGPGVQCTVGRSADEAAEDIRTMGGEAQECAVDDIVVDARRRLVSTPAYMLAGSPAEAFPGIDKLVREVLRMAGS